MINHGRASSLLKLLPVKEGPEDKWAAAIYLPGIRQDLWDLLFLTSFLIAFCKDATQPCTISLQQTLREEHCQGCGYKDMPAKPETWKFSMLVSRKYLCYYPITAKGAILSYFLLSEPVRTHTKKEFHCNISEVVRKGWSFIF